MDKNKGKTKYKKENKEMSFHLFTFLSIINNNVLQFFIVAFKRWLLLLCCFVFLLVVVDCGWWDRKYV